MQEMLYAGDLIWNDSTITPYDPRRLAWIDNNERPALGTFLNGAAPRSSETVKVTYPNPQCVELDAKLELPGIVVLADIYYPGWKLTIDGQPAKVYRVNQAMRGAAVPAGTHRLIYTYEPRSFQIGGAITIAGLVVSALATGFLLVRQQWIRPTIPEPN